MIAAETLIPLERLHGACGAAMWIVRRTWPAGIPVTLNTALDAQQLKLPPDSASWLAKRLGVLDRFKNELFRSCDHPYVVLYRVVTDEPPFNPDDPFGQQWWER